jgi:hypothetical protein
MRVVQATLDRIAQKQDKEGGKKRGEKSHHTFDAGRNVDTIFFCFFSPYHRVYCIIEPAPQTLHIRILALQEEIHRVSCLMHYHAQEHKHTHIYAYTHGHMEYHQHRLMAASKHIELNISPAEDCRQPVS